MEPASEGAKMAVPDSFALNTPESKSTPASRGVSSKMIPSSQFAGYGVLLTERIGPNTSVPGASCAPSVEMPPQSGVMVKYSWNRSSTRLKRDTEDISTCADDESVDAVDFALVAELGRSMRGLSHEICVARLRGREALRDAQNGYSGVV